MSIKRKNSLIKKDFNKVAIVTTTTMNTTGDKKIKKMNKNM